MSACFWMAASLGAAVPHNVSDVHLPAALMALKNKKLYETQLEQVENNMLRVNEQKIMLENQRATIETVSALKMSAESSKATMKEMKIEKVDQIFDDINEQNDQMREIQEALGQSLGACLLAFVALELLSAYSARLLCGRPRKELTSCCCSLLTQQAQLRIWTRRSCSQSWRRWRQSSSMQSSWSLLCQP